MKVRDALEGVRRLFLDSAPVIYYVEQDAQRIAVLDEAFDRISSGELIAVTGPVTLAECLVHPYRLGDVVLQQDFFDLIVSGANTTFSTIDHECARGAKVSSLARYGSAEPVGRNFPAPPVFLEVRPLTAPIPALVKMPRHPYHGHGENPMSHTSTR